MILSLLHKCQHTKIHVYGMYYSTFNTGFVTDGEFHTLRRKGDDGIPIHLYQIIADLRPGVNRLSEKKLLQILTKCGGK